MERDEEFEKLYLGKFNIDPKYSLLRLERLLGRPLHGIRQEDGFNIVCDHIISLNKEIEKLQEENAKLSINQNFDVSGSPQNTKVLGLNINQLIFIKSYYELNSGKKAEDLRA